MSTNGRTRAWVEVDASALRRNLARIADAVPTGTGLIPMVKADAYGLGMMPAVQALRPLDPLAWGVATVAEGLALRAHGVERDIIVFTPAPPGAVADAVAAGLTLSLSSLEGVRRFLEAVQAGTESSPTIDASREGTSGSPGPAFQIEIDTGMGRSGFDWRGVSQWATEVNALSEKAAWTGCFTHFHSADRPAPEPVEIQWTRFHDAVAKLEVPKTPEFVLHACNSAAALRGSAAVPLGPGTAVRPGIFLYGGAAGEGLPAPEPVAHVRSRVLLVRDVPPGTTQGYGTTYRARAWERWATIGMGYGDGLPRALSNRGSALVRGHRVPIIGRISMDVLVVDITGLEAVSPGDVVTFLGSDQDQVLTPDQLAHIADTIGYEILTRLTTRLPRIWMDDGT